MDENTSLDTEMNRGFLHVLVLAALEEPLHGYLMLRRFQAAGYSVEENTLYPLLRRLEAQGLVESQWQVHGERPRKIYSITPRGRTVRQRLLDIWERQDKVLRGLAKGI
jgi:DNA-binding PadR family transcriptional regulator